MTEQLTPKQLVEVVREDRRRRWERGDRVRAEAYLEQYPQLAADPALAVELVYHEILLREQLGESVAAAEYLHRFPQLAGELGPLFEVHDAFNQGAFGDTPSRLSRQQTPHPDSDEAEEPSWPTVPVV